MNSVTFVIVKKESPDGRYPYTVLRMSDTRQDVVSHHEAIDQATEAAQRYASQARFAGLAARIYYRDWLVERAVRPRRG